MGERIKAWLSDPTVTKLIAVAFTIAVVYGIGRALRRSVSTYVKDTAVRYKARKLISVSVFGAGALIAAIVFSDRLAGLAVGLGVAGVGVAFALKEVIASAAGWMVISMGKFYKPGDRVQLAGIKGDVIDIGVFRTTLMEIGEWVAADLYNGRIVRIANSSVLKQPVFNYSADFPFLWDEITLPVRYGSDWKLAKSMLLGVADEVCRDFARQSQEAWKEAVNKYRLEPAQVEPVVTLIANDNWLEFTLRYVVDYRKRRSVKDQLFTRILDKVYNSGERIRLASATLELVGLPKLDLSFHGGNAGVEAKQAP